MTDLGGGRVRWILKLLWSKNQKMLTILSQEARNPIDAVREGVKRLTCNTNPDVTIIRTAGNPGSSGEFMILGATHTAYIWVSPA